LLNVRYVNQEKQFCSKKSCSLRTTKK